MPAVPVAPRRRDYRLTPEDAARLRPTGWRRALAWLAAPGSTVRPLASGLAALGVVGILLTTGLPGFGAGGAVVLSAAGAPVDGQSTTNAETDTGSERNTYAPGAVPSAAPRAASTGQPYEVPVPGLAGEASPAVPDASAEPNTAAATPDEVLGVGKGAPRTLAEQEGLPLPLVLSVALLAAGLGLFAARAFALRRIP